MFCGKCHYACFRDLDEDHMLIKDIETVNHEKKIRGFFTVTVYIFAVSFLAILLSIYYIFVWTNPNIQAYCWYMKVRIHVLSHMIEKFEKAQTHISIICSENQMQIILSS